jgi:hypothetical protein
VGSRESWHLLWLGLLRVRCDGLRVKGGGRDLSIPRRDRENERENKVKRPMRMLRGTTLARKKNVVRG